MAPLDKTLGRVSKAATLALLGGLLALPFLPAPDQAPRTAPQSVQRNAGRPPAKAPVQQTPAEKPAAPEARAPATDSAQLEPKDDVWNEAEVAGGLRECLRLLAPVAAEVVIEEPIKKGPCGSPAPLRLRSVGETEKVTLKPAPTMNCRLAARMAQWVDTVLQPAAQEILGSRITRIVGASSYACRNIYNRPNGPLSEHATGSAIDMGRFVTEDGRTISVAGGWGATERDIAAAEKKKAAETEAAAEKRKDEGKAEEPKPPEQAALPKKKPDPEDATGSEGKVIKTGYSAKNPASEGTPDSATLTAATTPAALFLKRLHRGACSMFGTVLGPEANEAHRDHFHFDVKKRRRRAVCH
jgi:hypothetical protein